MIPARLTLALLGAAGLMAAGAGLWHITPVIGPGPRLASAQVELDRRGQALREAATALRQGAQDLRARDVAIQQQADQAAAESAGLSVYWKGQCRHAFNAGFAACGGDDDPGGMRDLRALQAAGAFRAAPAVPSLDHGRPDR